MKLVVLYGETISLLDKVNKLTENVGPASFTLTKEITVTYKITLLAPTAHEYRRIISSSSRNKLSSTRP